MRLYRYSSNRNNNALNVLGNIRIGTLHDFRRDEHKRGIADAWEGRKIVHHHIDNLLEGPNSARNQQAMSAFNVIRHADPSRPGNMVNIGVGIEFNEPDCYVHCTSYRLSKEVMQEFDGTESCLEIANPRGFYDRLTESMGKLVSIHEESFKLEAVRYQPRIEQYNFRDWGDDAAYIKDEEFKGQFEIRATWLPKSRSEILKPVILNDVGLVQYCKIIECLVLK